jgi:guanosine-3',5'-bis(diphosphate) 3'-pyrophosphohydrolase
VDNDLEDTLFKVREFADNAHGNQVRKYTGEKYITHPVRVMEMVSEYNQEIPVLSAALLHDVIEDTLVGKRELGNFLKTVMSEPQALETLALVEELTDIYVKADYPQLNRRVRRTKEAERLSAVSAKAQTIKYADIIDNVLDIVHHESDFALVYIREGKQILDKMPMGNPQLYVRALKTIDDCLLEYWNKANVKAL